MASNYMHGSPVLLGDATVPGVKIPDNLAVLIDRIKKEVKDFGCDYYPTVVEMLTYDEISEVAAYGGFPVRFPHWKWGMEYEELQRGYEAGMHRIYEMVVNTNPCYVYCLDSNTLVDNVTVVAHALFHNDFFKNNIFFAPTSQNMMNQLASNGSSIRKYISRWGKEKVTEFIDTVLQIETLIDPAKAWEKKTIRDVVLSDQRVYQQPARIDVLEDHEYMEDYINPPKWKEQQRERVLRADAAREIGLFKEPTKDIMGFIKDHAPLKPWQADIVSMLYEESMYFAPQRVTKMLNEGWASFGDFNMISRKGLCSLGQEGDGSGIIEYAMHKAGVLGGKYSLNPYKIGYCLFLDIEERWDKGRFGSEYEQCTDLIERQNWDKKLGLGHDKVFDVRKYHNDVTALMEFFTEEFCNKYEFFEWQHFPNGEYKLVSRDYKKIKSKLIQRSLNGGRPDLRLTDPNYHGEGTMMIQHQWEGRVLYEPYVKSVLRSLYKLWQNDVFLASRDADGEEIIYCAYGDSDDMIELVDRDELEKGNL